jgi:hypothetical protein
MNSIYKVTKGDTAKALDVVLSDARGVVDLTDCSVKIYMAYQGTFNKKIDGAACSIISPLLGKVRYSFTAQDVDTAGVFDVQFVVTNLASKTVTFPTDTDGRSYLKLHCIKSVK